MSDGKITYCIASKQPVPYLLALIVVLALSLLQHAYAEFSFQKQFSYVDETKVMHVLGEIKNDSDRAMKNVLVTISFYDKEGSFLDKSSRTTALRVLNPGESSPFEVPLIDSKLVDHVANFSMTAEGQTTDPKERQLKIISSNSRLDLLGTYYINANARNDGHETATNTIMIATLLDKDGRVIALGSALAEAGPGSYNITAGSEAPFGISITDKTQTYSAAKYSLVADSDQYSSDVMVLNAAGPGSSIGNQNQTQSRCLIATAAFGSELSPQVQQLRLFRDGIALKTSAGTGFMNAFNIWYYSFSPAVASYERQEPWLQNTVKTLIYPLLWILGVSTFVYDSLNFSSELGIIASGIVASSLIGLLYFAPVGASLGIASRKKGWKMSVANRVLACSWITGAVAVLLAELGGSESAMMFATSLLVLSAIGTAIMSLARIVKW